MDQGSHELEEQGGISVLIDGARAPAVDVDASQPVDDMIQEMLSKLNQQVTNPNQLLPVPKGSEGPSIFRVPGKTGKQVVNIGRLLYVGGHPNVPINTEMMWRYVGFMKRWAGLDPISYINHFIDRTEMIRSCYGEEICLSPREISVSLLLGSCFILVVILLRGVRRGPYSFGFTEENINGQKDQLSQELSSLYEQVKQYHMTVILDMLKLENQIPWFAIEVAYKNSKLLKEVKDPVATVLGLFVDLYPQWSWSCDSDIHDLPKLPFKHLLHIFHYTGTSRNRPQLSFTIQASELYIPSATDLLESATDFKALQEEPFSVRFDRAQMSAVMELAPLTILNYSSEKLCNLIDFEQRYLKCRVPVSNYVAVMVRLLQSEADVKLLKRNRIVANTMKTDKELLDVIQELRSKVEDACIDHDLLRLSRDVIEAHESPANRRCAGFKKQYCSNPWITIFVIGAIFLFILTIIQAVYCALRYYKG